jgi:hypothetical protein
MVQEGVAREQVDGSCSLDPTTHTTYMATSGTSIIYMSYAGGEGHACLKHAPHVCEFTGQFERVKSNAAVAVCGVAHMQQLLCI